MALQMISFEREAFTISCELANAHAAWDEALNA
jgi:hypothetical protein